MRAPAGLRAMAGGGWMATCGRCKDVSRLVRAASDHKAWGALKASGWTAYQHSRGSRRYAVCPTCSNAPAKGGV